ncbi:MAG: helix-turn-helix transcriptional regulator, partial [Betaproteobacteria bacterium]
DVLHYLGKALAHPAGPIGDSPPAHVAEEGLAVLAADGSTRLSDENWLRLARMARGEHIAPGSARIEGDAIPKFTFDVLAAASVAASGVHTVESAWGRFTFRAFAMQGEDGAQASALLVSRLAMEPVGLAEGAARLGLTLQQREVALLLTQGLSNADIAARLGVSINTANYHVKRLFSRLGVHERQQIANALRDAAGGYRSGSG